MAFRTSSTRATPSEPLPFAADPPDSAAAATTVAAVIELEEAPALTTPGSFFGGSIVSPVKIGSPYCTSDSGELASTSVLYGIPLQQ